MPLVKDGTHNLIRSISEILIIDNLKPNALESVSGVFNAAHLRDTISHFDTMCDMSVVSVVLVVCVCHAPFVDAEL